MLCAVLYLAVFYSASLCQFSHVLFCCAQPMHPLLHPKPMHTFASVAPCSRVLAHASVPAMQTHSTAPSLLSFCILLLFQGCCSILPFLVTSASHDRVPGVCWGVQLHQVPGQGGWLGTFSCECDCVRSALPESVTLTLEAWCERVTACRWVVCGPSTCLIGWLIVE